MSICIKRETVSYDDFMKQPPIIIVTSACALSGGVVGAGFITGREISSFFAFDFSVSGAYSFAVVFVLCFLISFISVRQPIFDFCLNFFVSLINLVVLACLFSAFNTICATCFRLSEKVKLFSIISAILMFFIARNDMRNIKIITSVIVPVEVIILIISALCVPRKSLPYSPSTSKGVFYPLLYAGINFLLNIRNADEILNGQPLKNKIFSVAVSVCLLTSLIILIASVVGGVEGNTPFIDVVDKRSHILGLLLNGTTLSSCFIASLTTGRSVFRLCGDSDILKFLFVIIALAMSEAGFSFIIDKIYPVIGAIGLFVSVCMLFLLIFFQKGRQRRTSDRQDNIKLRCLPLQDRV